MLTPSSAHAVPDFLRRIDSPIGRIELVSNGDAITSLSIEQGGALQHDHLPEISNAVLELAVDQLAQYFAGTRREFDVPVAVIGTEFQRQIWHELSQLAWGEVTSYGWLGVATGRQTAGRAVGGAVGANPIPILIPCHRVLASDGRITGYSAGSGIPTKMWLLEHEGIPFAAPAGGALTSGSQTPSGQAA